LGFIEKIIDVAVILGAVAAMLHQVPWGRTLGTSLLASAGVASVIIGFAAQRTLANLIAGFQIAFTQPMRIDDAVVVEDEWGWIEEITLTYVVVRIWDRRRLVLPITYFIEKPFQNWTRTSGQILGSVHLTVSHEASFDRIEERFNALLDTNELWDRDARVLQVIESSERSVTLRALMTAKDSPTCWDLRCAIRRGLLEFMAKEHPAALPSIRLRSVPGIESPESERAVA
jgi:small-conductance mechanosensitive channel